MREFFQTKHIKLEDPDRNYIVIETSCGKSFRVNLYDYDTQDQIDRDCQDMIMSHIKNNRGIDLDKNELIVIDTGEKCGILIY